MADTKETQPVADIKKPQPTAETESEHDFVGHLTDEYKIIQDKIDKIGAFRFTIKGWSITVLVGALFAAGAANSARSPFWVLPLLLFLGIFFWLEKRQSDISNRLSLRALQIERTVSRFLRRSRHKDFLVLRFVPGIGHHIRPAGNRNARPYSLWRSCWEAHLQVYVLQAIVVLVVVLWPHRNESAPQRIVIVNGSEILRTAGSNTVDKPQRLPANETKANGVGIQQSTKDANPTASPASGDRTHEESKKETKSKK